MLTDISTIWLVYKLITCLFHFSPHADDPWPLARIIYCQHSLSCAVLPTLAVDVSNRDLSCVGEAHLRGTEVCCCGDKQTLLALLPERILPVRILILIRKQNASCETKIKACYSEFHAEYNHRIICMYSHTYMSHQPRKCPCRQILQNLRTSDFITGYWRRAFVFRFLKNIGCRDIFLAAGSLWLIYYWLCSRAMLYYIPPELCICWCV